MNFTVTSRAPSTGTTTRSETPPNSPRGYLNQIRIPRPGADDLTRLICCLLNFLQGNLRQPRGYNSNFFKIHTTNGYELFSTLLLPASAIVKSTGLFLPTLSYIKVLIRVWKAIERGEMHYQIEALATCYDRDDQILSDGRKLLHVEIFDHWYIVDGEDTSDLEDMEWNTVLRLLRRASKRNFNMYGEERSEEEEERIDRERANLFYIGDRARVHGEY